MSVRVRNGTVYSGVFHSHSMKDGLSIEVQFFPRSFILHITILIPRSGYSVLFRSVRVEDLLLLFLTNSASYVPRARGCPGSS